MNKKQPRKHKNAPKKVITSTKRVRTPKEVKQSKKYYKFTHTDENHNGFVYQDGLNVDTLPFAKKGSCCAGGLYFSDANNIHKFFDAINHEWIREIYVDESKSNFVKDNSNSYLKYRAHKITCGVRRNLNDVSTWEWMISEGIVLHEFLFQFAVNRSNIDLVKFVFTLDNYELSEFVIDDVLIRSVSYPDPEMAKFLLSLKGIKYSDSFRYELLTRCDPDSDISNYIKVNYPVGFLYATYKKVTYFIKTEW